MFSRLLQVLQKAGSNFHISLAILDHKQRVLPNTIVGCNVFDFSTFIQTLPLIFKNGFGLNERDAQEKAVLTKMVKASFDIAAKLDKLIMDEDKEGLLVDYILKFKCNTETSLWKYWQSQDGPLPTFKEIVRTAGLLDNDFLQDVDNLSLSNGKKDLEEVHDTNNLWRAIFLVLVDFPYRLDDYQMNENPTMKAKIARKNATAKVEA